MIHLGTSGYSFRDWTDALYPAGTPPGAMLELYAREFAVVEINSTYYRVPHPRVFAGMDRKTPSGFRFTVKLPADVTHRQTRDPAAFAAFAEAVRPIRDSGKLYGALAQFPFGFRNAPVNRDYLRFLRDAYGADPLFVEFRHESWATRNAFALLEEIGAGFCAVDEPRLPGLFPPLVRATGETGYVRFHGRNARDWWSGTAATRYNYLYSEEELRGWVEAIRRLEGRSKEVYLFFNNCHAGNAVRNARQMRLLLGLGATDARQEP